MATRPAISEDEPQARMSPEELGLKLVENEKWERDIANAADALGADHPSVAAMRAAQTQTKQLDDQVQQCKSKCNKQCIGSIRAHGGKKKKSRKGKSRKGKSRKGKSRKGRKAKSRKAKSRKGRKSRK